MGGGFLIWFVGVFCLFFFFLVVVLNSNSYNDGGNVLLNELLIFLGVNILQPIFLCIPHIFLKFVVSCQFICAFLTSWLLGTYLDP